MRSQSSLVCFLLLISFVSYCASSAAVPDGDIRRKLEADLFETPEFLDDEGVIGVMEDGEKKEEQEKFINEFDAASRRRDALEPAGWRRFRRRINRAFRRIGGGVRRVFIEPWKICLGKCLPGRKRPVLLTLQFLRID
eukprot:TsM_000095200 transcript=TsM_000095200 gene=TsM_000095200